MKHTTDIRVLLRHINRASEFLRWLQADGDHLIASAYLLGGPNWAQRARSVVKAAREGRDLSARRVALKGLQHLLHLDLVQDLKSQEALCFARLHPDDPRADVARQCAEAMSRGVRALEALRLVGIKGSA
ncbi:hypothetical protein FDP25_05780 [Roseovarius sp. A21]|uniref:Uncharacterized protein n=1 Tax=Roseovarius bejariae TaxID=2576383 RepID=A0A844D181_9RHOB|nr:hypothetical protein [Roseovarius bejariae]MRU14938.1 hypothetical protein [Roseovarius bejariae]